MKRSTHPSFFHKAARILANNGVRAALLALCGAWVFVVAQDKPQKSSHAYELMAYKAYEAKEYKSFLENMKLAAGDHPSKPRFVYNLAAAYAVNGQPQQALAWLGQLARWGLAYEPEKSSAFASLKPLREFQALGRAFDKNRVLVIHSLPAFTVEEKGVIPESVAYDPVGKVFYLSSVYKRKILALDQAGKVTEFATERDGLWSVLGMKVDAQRQLLWVTTSAQPLMSHYQKQEDGRAGVFKYDLRNGALLQKFLLPNQPKPHALGDLAVSPQGDVYVTDSLSPAIYVIRPTSQQLELFFEGDPFVSPQGLDFTPDGKRMFVADYENGIFVLDLKAKTATPLAPAPDSTLSGIDGLYLHRGSLIAVQNGTSPHRVIRLTLSPDDRRVTGLTVLEANNPRFDEPTLGVLVRDTFYFVANSQWGAVDKDGQLEQEKLQNPLVLKIDLAAIPNPPKISPAQ